MPTILAQNEYASLLSHTYNVSNNRQVIHKVYHLYVCYGCKVGCSESVKSRESPREFFRQSPSW